MMTLKRRDDWRARMHQAIDASRRRPFAWGEHDCWTFCGAVVAAMTGRDIAAPWLGRYATRTGALRVMRNDGFASLADGVASLLPEHEHVSRARLGDIAAVPLASPFGFAVGIVGGERVFVLRPEGVGTVSLLQCTRAFRVGQA